MDDEIAARVREIIGSDMYSRNLPPLTDDVRLKDIDDSLGRVEVSISLEEAFGIELDERTILRWKTIGDVIASVRRSLETK